MTGPGEKTAGHPWLPVPTCTAGLCLPRSVPAVGRARRLARWAALAAVLTAGVALAPVARGRRTAAAAARLWSRALVRALGVRLLTTGTGRPVEGPGQGSGRGSVQGPALVVANHISWLDVPLLAAVAPGRMLAKSEVAGYPVLGRLAAYGGTVFVDRERLRALPGTVASLASLLRSGSTVVAFPEGSTWCGREGGGPFRHAVFQAALDAGVPVQPIAVRYRAVGATGRGSVAGSGSGSGSGGGGGGGDGDSDDRTAVTAFVGEDTLLASLRRVIAARGVVAEVTVLPAIPPGTHASRAALAGAAGRAVSAAGNLPLPGHRTWQGEGEGEDRRWRRTGTTRSTARRLVRVARRPVPAEPPPLREAQAAPAGKPDAAARTAPAAGLPRVPAQRRPSP